MVDILSGIPQGSVFSPLLFKIFIVNLFFFISRSEICNSADDNTLYYCGQVLENILCNLKHDLHNILKWFQLNSLKLNPNEIEIESHKVVLLGVTTAEESHFKRRIENICWVAN